MKPKAYYAHPIALRSSPIVAQDIKVLKCLGFHVVNPGDPCYSTLQMDGFVNLAKTCDVVAFRAFDDGKIGSGMALEISAAGVAGVPIIEMGAPHACRILTRNETRARMELPPLRHPDTAPLRTVIEELTGEDTGYADSDWGNS